MKRDRIREGLEWLMGEVSASRAEFRIGNQPDGEELLDGLVSQGYVREQHGRYAVNPVGNRRMRDTGKGND